MAKDTTIQDFGTIEVHGYKFEASFYHLGGLGYIAAVTPWVQNTDPTAPEKQLVVIGSPKAPGITQEVFDTSKRYSKGKGQDLTTMAVMYLVSIVRRILKVYGVEENPVALLAQIKGIDQALKEQTASQMPAYLHLLAS